MRFTTVLVLLLAPLLLWPPEPAHADSKTRVIAIDPGHGGDDPGAIGPAGTYEKTVTLQIARRLQSLINRQPGMRAILTRSGDRYLLFEERIAIARRQRADLFLSIHADAHSDPSKRGSSVFILSERGASSVAAHWLADRENRADRVGGGMRRTDKSVRPVVFDIYHDAVVADGLAVAGSILSELRRVGAVHTGGVERAGFAVLKAPDMPAVLVETAFLSNPQEETRLRSARYQQQVAQAIAQGVRYYFRGHPARQPVVQAKTDVATPPRTVAAGGKKVQTAATQPVRPARRSKPAVRQVHVVRQGESLADVAQHYRVGLTDLRALNGLSKDRVRLPAGTRLTIPDGDS